MRGFMFLVWFSAATAVFAMVAEYDSRPGVAAPTLEQRPSTSTLPTPQQTQIVMLLHPQCPCSRASLEELTQLISRCGGDVSTVVLAFAPPNDPARWRNSPGCKIAAAIPGVELRMDVGGKEARRLGATTSGHVVIFDRQGRRLFSGGIMAGRAMVGDNSGFDAALKALRTGERRSNGSTAVYGCPILTPQAPTP